MNKTDELYEQIFLNVAKQSLNIDEMLYGKIIKYKNVRVPKYLKLKVPFIKKDYDNDSEYGTGEFRGWLFGFREINGPQIGTEVVKQAVRRKATGETITFRRYGPIEDDKTKPLNQR